ncbi:hypothetical protein HDC94_002710 [Leifsonia sp. AK011]|uniref:glycosyltransferase n=1 Tax=Leifsonia sp. AK011 TaxID=2723075 RepID=UPI0015CA750C|nr:glycosyltransferase [Leifsonia sp. AK011]NYF11554.1 hypothetical protein [Leifsonia sp. AK011]
MPPADAGPLGAVARVRRAVGRIPGVRALAEKLGVVQPPPPPGFDDRPIYPEVRQYLRELDRSNRFSRRSAIDPDSEMVVTMTTHGDRFRRVHVALESIASGVERPGRLILWLDDPSLRPSRALRRLMRRGVEVRQVEPGLGVHTKYYPYVSSIDRHSRPLVTSDDDKLYPPTWLAELAAAARQDPDIVHCLRAHHIEFEGDRIAPYESWTPCTSTEPSLRTFGTSVSGQVFPPRVLDLLREAGTAFLEIAPKADDVWLHRIAISAGIPVAQVTETPRIFPFVPETQAGGLYMSNLWEGGNDAQIAATYTEDDLRALRAAR